MIWELFYLDLGALVADAARHGGEGGELVGCNLGVDTRQRGEQRGLPHRRETCGEE